MKKFTSMQKDFLEYFNASDGGCLHILESRTRTAKSLEKRGLLKYTKQSGSGGGVACLTPLGKKVAKVLPKFR